MKQQLENPKHLVGFWLAVGVALGLSLGMLMHSYTVGIPAGLAASFLLAKISYVIARVAK